MLDSQAVNSFQKFIYTFFEQYGRHHLAWRMNLDPYRVLVSEIMLQQTQVDRVLPKFEHFLDLFPDFSSLAQAPSSQVIRAWQGLGYNRRVLNLQKTAQSVMEHFGGQLPSDSEKLLSLPGIGPYTSASIQAFAFNLPSLVIETNIRTVFIYHFFPDSYKVSDSMIVPLISATLDQENPRKWYSALMDYGSFLKQVVPNPTRQSQKYLKQSAFKGSNRQVRGAILQLAAQETLDTQTLSEKLALPYERIAVALEQLIAEGFLRQNQNLVTLID